MDASVVIQTISNVGFPIAVCLICFWYVNKLTETHKDEVNKLTDALNNNTLVMQKLCDKLGVQTDADNL